MLSVENIKLSYNNIPVIHDVSFRVGKNEIVSLIGGNGNGKSTILKGLSGIMHPTSGKILFNDHDITMAEADKIVALGMSHVPEGRRLFPNLSVYKNLLLGAYLISDKKTIADRLEYVYSIFPKLKDRSQQKANTLSGGEQQMVAIGRGLMAGPKLLMLDEPSLGLAPLLVEEVFQVITEINRSGVTVLLVEQNTQHALSLAHKGFVMESGKIVLSGSGSELLANINVRKAYLGL